MENITRVHITVDANGGPAVQVAAEEARAAAVWIGAEDDPELEELRQELEHRHE